MNNIVTITAKSFTIDIVLFGNCGPSYEMNQFYNMLYLLIHQDLVSAFEEKRNKEFTPNSIQFIRILLLEIFALSIFNYWFTFT